MEAFFGEFPLPAIAHVVVDGALFHYVVIHRITKEEVIIANVGKGLDLVSFILIQVLLLYIENEKNPTLKK